MAMDVVDYEIKGAEMQFVEVELDPGEASRLASRVFAAAPQRGGSREEGSVLGSFGAGGAARRGDRRR